MREEITHWWKQAESDLRKAEVLFKSGDYDGVAFYSQQSVEKALKAIILFKTNEKAEGHSLVYLGKIAKAPEDFFSGFKKLSPQYFLSRYPDASEEIPYELYDQENTKEFLVFARRILEWIKKQLG